MFLIMKCVIALITRKMVELNINKIYMQTQKRMIYHFKNDQPGSKCVIEKLSNKENK